MFFYKELADFLYINKDDLLRQGSLIGEKIGFKKGVAAGISRGRSEGFSDGSRHAKLETAKNLLGLGLSVEKIMQATGLTKEEVETISF